MRISDWSSDVCSSNLRIQTGCAPRAADGPDLNQIFVGSEGTLGIITGARLRLHTAPRRERRAAYTFDSFAAGLDAMRRVLQRGATPAVLRLYDPTEAARTYSTGDRALLLVLDEGDGAIVEPTMERDRKRVVSGQSGPRRLDLGGRRLVKKKKNLEK